MPLFASISNREMNIWATLLLDVIVAIYYFGAVFAMPDLTGPAMAKLIGKIIVFSIIFSIVVFSLINARGEEKADERDYRIESRANAIAYYTLAACVGVLLVQIVISTIFPDHSINQWWDLASSVVIANVLLMTLVLASCAKACSQLFQYRRGY